MSNYAYYPPPGSNQPGYYPPSGSYPPSTHSGPSDVEQPDNATLALINVTLGGVIGQSNLSDIFSGRMNGVKVAVKAFRMTGEQTEEDARRRLRREARTWVRLRHDRVLPCIGITQINYCGVVREAIVSPWMKNGTITQFLEKTLQQNVLRLKLELVTQIARGLEYLHRQGVIHGDIKANNILIDDSETVRITDFGRSFTLAAGDCSQNILGSAAWMAPEILLYESNGFPPYSKGSDVWSLGITILEIFDGKNRLWGGVKAPAGLIRRVSQGGTPQLVHYPNVQTVGGLWRTLENCFERDPTQRHSARRVASNLDELLEDAYH